MNLLDGLRVVSLAINIPGPVAAARLRDLGARVIKIEPPRGDPLALACIAYYEELHRGIEVRVLDLKDAEQRAECDRLLETADLLLTATRPETLRSLELHWTQLHARFPALCHAAIVGFPSPDENRPGHDLTYAARSGMLAPPQLPRVLVADMAGAEQAVSAALALLLARERGHGAEYREVALAKAAEDFTASLRQGLTAPGGLLGGGLPSYNLYAAKTGYVAVAALEAQYLDRLLQELGLAVATCEGFAQVFLTRTAREWEDWAQERDLPIAALSGA